MPARGFWRNLCPRPCVGLQCIKKFGKLLNLEILEWAEPIRFNDLGFQTPKKLEKKNYVEYPSCHVHFLVTCVFLL